MTPQLPTIDDAVRSTGLTYDRIAARYAERNRSISASRRDWLDSFLRLVPLHRGLPVLDAGCGPGADAIYLRRRGLSVVGIDLSEVSLRKAAEDDWTCWVQADFFRLPFPDATFAAVMMNSSFLHVPSLSVNPALREVRRVLQDGGLLGLTVPEGTREGWEQIPYNPDKHEYRGTELKRWYVEFEEDQLAEALIHNGFSPHQVRRRQHFQVWLEVFSFTLEPDRP